MEGLTVIDIKVKDALRMAILFEMQKARQKVLAPQGIIVVREDELEPFLDRVWVRMNEARRFDD